MDELLWLPSVGIYIVDGEIETYLDIIVSAVVDVEPVVGRRWRDS